MVTLEYARAYVDEMQRNGIRPRPTSPTRLGRLLRRKR
jgi:hypothetical protein